MQNIAETFFSSLTGPPSLDDFDFKSRGNQFDAMIRGWTKYWNEIFQPSELLDPDLVKTLIATESGFNPESDNKLKGVGRARGLMQLTDGTRKILNDEGGELRNHLVELSGSAAYNPNLNIAAGIRWLFHKHERASAKLKREATWMEAIWEYKAVRTKPRTNHEREWFPKIKADFQKYYESLKKRGSH
jgi:soluble lytic murein transglycosylase-like protein